MIDFHKTCKGASHIKTDKVCQDNSISITEPGFSVAIVSDGHGGDRYFRSDIGSKLACDISLELIRIFVNHYSENPFDGSPLTQIGINWECPDDVPPKNIAILKQLLGAILSQWQTNIKKHAQDFPLTDEEKINVSAEYHNLLYDEDKLGKVYGCTLMAYVQTAKYWFAFQIGDGKCFSFHKETGPKQPILWDDACFLNKTTSLCDSNAINEFRCTFEGDGKFPYAVVLGSDGLDDSFGEDKNLINFYIQVLKLVFNSNKEHVEEILSKDLPVLSLRGSQDDMSVAGVVDEFKKDNALRELIEWQINNIQGELNQNKARIHKFHKERKSLAEVRKDNPKAAIDYDYAVKEILSSIELRRKLIERYNNLAKELNNENPKIFNDDIPYDKVIPVIDKEEIIESDETQTQDNLKATEKYHVISTANYGGQGFKSPKRFFRKKGKKQLKKIKRHNKRR